MTFRCESHLLIPSLLLVMSACSRPIVVHESTTPPLALEEDRVAQAIVPGDASGSGEFVYDIWYSGFLSSDVPVDLAVLRERCRPGKLVSVTEEHVGLYPTLTAYIYTPRQIRFECSNR